VLRFRTRPSSKPKQTTERCVLRIPVYVVAIRLQRWGSCTDCRQTYAAASCVARLQCEANFASQIPDASEHPFEAHITASTCNRRAPPSWLPPHADARHTVVAPLPPAFRRAFRRRGPPRRGVPQRRQATVPAHQGRFQPSLPDQRPPPSCLPACGPPTICRRATRARRCRTELTPRWQGHVGRGRHLTERVFRRRLIPRSSSGAHTMPCRLAAQSTARSAAVTGRPPAGTRTRAVRAVRVSSGSYTKGRGLPQSAAATCLLTACTRRC